MHVLFLHIIIGIILYSIIIIIIGIIIYVLLYSTYSYVANAPATFYYIFRNFGQCFCTCRLIHFLSRFT